jgi:hypothetical protein
VPASYTIKNVRGPKEWTGQYGAMHSYYIELDGLEGEHELSQKTTTAPPAVGESLFGDSTPPVKDGFPKKFKKAMQGSGFRGNGGGRDLSPEAQSRIDASGRAQGRAHAQEMALRWYALVGTIPENLPELTKAIDWFFDDAQAAKAEGYRS